MNLKRSALKIKMKCKGKVLTPVDICATYIRSLQQPAEIVKGSCTMGSETIEYFFVKVSGEIHDIVGEYSKLFTPEVSDFVYQISEEPGGIHDEVSRERYAEYTANPGTFIGKMVKV
jgi:hypothetical protein